MIIRVASNFAYLQHIDAYLARVDAIARGKAQASPSMSHENVNVRFGQASSRSIYSSQP